MFSIDNYHKLYGQAKEHYIAEVQIDTNSVLRELLSFIKDQSKTALPTVFMGYNQVQEATGSTEYVDSLKPKLSVVSTKKNKKSKKPKKD
jgi:hypothetical protein